MTNKPEAGKWYMCSLRQGGWCRNTVLYCPVDGIFDLPLEWAGIEWQQEDVTITHNVQLVEVEK